MVASLLTPSNITFCAGVVAMLFTAYTYFKDPQTEEEKKTSLLQQNLDFRREENDRRFSEIQTSIKEAFALGQNHIHTVDTKVDGLTGVVGNLSVELAKLSTIIEERIPRHK